MAYIVQSTRVSSLTIGPRDFTDSLISWQVSDSSVNGNGLMETTGTVVVAQRPGQTDIEDYKRSTWARGTSVVLRMEDENGTTFRHPRGQLYVMASSYSPEDETLTFEIGCRIALANLTDEIDELLTFLPIDLDPAQQNIQSLASALFAAGEVLYQNNTGELVKRKFFGNDSTTGIQPGDWTSVFGQTTLSVAPLAGTTVIPDSIKISYDVPVPVEEDDTQEDENGNKYVEDVEVSNYFLQYPASAWRRDPDAGTECLLTDANGNTTEVACIEDGGGVNTVPEPEEPVSSDCGNTPSQPDTNYDDGSDEDSFTIAPVSCNYGWGTTSEPVFVSAKATRTSRTEYGGPAQQVSRVYEEVRGPAVEVNSQYFADSHAYCVYLYGYACNPNGGCPFDGQTSILQSYAETLYEYGNDNELVKTTRDTFYTILSAAQTFDWRSGNTDGVPQNFDTGLKNRTDMYRAQRVVTEYLESTQSKTVEKTTTYDSPSTRGVGIKAGNLDAIGGNGIITTVTRTSTTYSSLPDQPDTLAAALTETQTESTEAVLGADLGTTQYVGPAETGPYVLEVSLPVPVLDPDGEVREEFIQKFVDLVPRWVKGDAYGMQIIEALRSDIVNNWYPGKPFRYADLPNNRILGLRMNACGWSVTQSGAVVGTDGIWTGFSSGTINFGSNVVGDSAPDMSQDQSGTPTPPPNPTPVPPSVDNDVVGFDVAEIVNVHFYLDTTMTPAGDADGVIPEFPTDLADRTFRMEEALVVFVAGAIVEPGTLLQTVGPGGMPIGSNGTLLTTGTVVVDNDLFAPAA